MYWAPTVLAPPLPALLQTLLTLVFFVAATLLPSAVCAAWRAFASCVSKVRCVVVSVLEFWINRVHGAAKQ